MIRVHNPSVQKLHEVANRAAWCAVASLDHADIPSSVVTEAQKRGKAGLREPGPLADGFEGGGGHLAGVPKHDGAAKNIATDERVFAQIGLGVQFSKLLAGRVDADQFAATAVGNEDEVAILDNRALLAVEVGHFILPCPVEHRSVADDTLIRNNVPIVNRKMHMAKIFHIKGKE